MKKVRLIVVGVVLTFVSVVFTSCTNNSEDYDPVLTEELVTDIDDPKSDGEDEGEKEEEGGGTGSDGPG